MKKLTTESYHYDYDCPNIEPKLVGFFNVNDTDDISYDITKLKTIKSVPEKVHWDLKKNNKIKAIRLNAQLKSFFQFLISHQRLLKDPDCEISNVINATIVTGGSVLLDIFEMFCMNQIDLLFCAHLLDGTIYLYVSQFRRENVGLYSHGCRTKTLKKYLLSASADSDESIADDDKFIGIYNLKLQNHNIIYRTEIDGVLLDGDGLQSDAKEADIIADIERRKIVSIKTSLRNEDHHNFRQNKIPYLWSNSVLTTSHTTIVGFRDYDDIVYENKCYDNETIEELGKPYWKKNIPTNFLIEFMTFIKKCFVEKIKEQNSSEVTLHFTRYANSPVELYNDQEINLYEWIPEWYQEIFKKNTSG